MARTLPRDVQLGILARLDIDGRRALGLIGKIKIPEDVRRKLEEIPRPTTFPAFDRVFTDVRLDAPGRPRGFLFELYGPPDAAWLLWNYRDLRLPHDIQSMHRHIFGFDGSVRTIANRPNARMEIRPAGECKP